MNFFFTSNAFVFVVLALLFAGCVVQGAGGCAKPNVTIAGECCLDQNNNSVCDEKEVQQCGHENATYCYQYLNTLNGSGTSMLNPAAVFCTCMGGNLISVEIAEGAQPDGGTVGMCETCNGSFEEWEYFCMLKPPDVTYPWLMGTCGTE